MKTTGHIYTNHFIFQKRGVITLNLCYINNQLFHSYCYRKGFFSSSWVLDKLRDITALLMRTTTILYTHRLHSKCNIKLIHVSSYINYSVEWSFYNFKKSIFYQSIQYCLGQYLLYCLKYYIKDVIHIHLLYFSCDVSYVFHWITPNLFYVQPVLSNVDKVYHSKKQWMAAFWVGSNAWLQIVRLVIGLTIQLNTYCNLYLTEWEFLDVQSIFRMSVVFLMKD